MNNRIITYLLMAMVAWMALLTAAFVLVTVAQIHFNRDTVDIMGQIVDLVGKLNK